MKRIDDKQRKKIIAAAVAGESNRSIAKRFHINESTVRNIKKADAAFAQKCAHKKEEAEASVLAYMDSRTEDVCTVIGLGIDALKSADMFAGATPPQITTAIGTLIDKWTQLEQLRQQQNQTQSAELDPLSKALMDEYGL